MAGKQRVYKLRMNDRAFAIIARAAYLSALETRRIETMPSLLIRLIETFDQPCQEVLEAFKEGEPYNGDQLVFGKIDEPTSEIFDVLKDRICEVLRRDCSILDTVIFLAIAFIRKKETCGS